MLGGVKENRFAPRFALNYLEDVGLQEVFLDGKLVRPREPTVKNSCVRVMQKLDEIAYLQAPAPEKIIGAISIRLSFSTQRIVVVLRALASNLLELTRYQ